MRLSTAALLLVACSRREPIVSCDDNLHGVYQTPGGRWMLLDNGKTLEAYPLFDDHVDAGAPRYIDLRRGDGAGPGGEVKRRFMQRADECIARAPFHVTACTDDELQVVAGDVTSPLTFQPCSWGQQVPTHVEVWRRQMR